jgi:tRNA(fMet)-specific endonuclease VapC
MDIILDTNCYNIFIDGDKKVIKKAFDSSIIYISAITIGELYSGFCKGNKTEDNLEILRRFLSNKKVKVANITKETSEIYGQTLSKLLNMGTPIPTNDVWIAASAIETNSTLITYDRHFLKIPNLKLWSGIK